MRRKLLSLTSAILSFSLLTACSDTAKNENSKSSAASGSALINYDEFAKEFETYPDLKSGPHLSFSNTTAKAGELAEVTISVKDADLQWNMCGIHVVYPDILKPDMTDSSSEVRDVRFEKGDAIADCSGAVCKEWQSGLPQPLVDKKLGCLFFTCMFSGNGGCDGEIAKFFLKIPDNAESGVIYNINCYYEASDLFSNAEGIPSFQKYAFANFDAGTITVE